MCVHLTLSQIEAFGLRTRTPDKERVDRRERKAKTKAGVGQKERRTRLSVLALNYDSSVGWRPSLLLTVVRSAAFVILILSLSLFSQAKTVMCLPILPVILASRLLFPSSRHTDDCILPPSFTSLSLSACERHCATLCSKQAIITSIYRIDLIEQKETSE